MCYYAEFGRSALKGVPNRKTPKSGRVLELHCLGIGGVAGSTIQAPPHMCYHVKFSSSATKGVHTNTREPHPTKGALWPRPIGGGGVADPKTSPIPIFVTTSNLVILRHRVYSQIQRNPKNCRALGPRPLTLWA